MNKKKLVFNEKYLVDDFSTVYCVTKLTINNYNYILINNTLFSNHALLLQNTLYWPNLNSIYLRTMEKWHKYIKWLTTLLKYIRSMVDQIKWLPLQTCVCVVQVSFECTGMCVQFNVLCFVLNVQVCILLHCIFYWNELKKRVIT